MQIYAKCNFVNILGLSEWTYGTMFNTILGKTLF